MQSTTTTASEILFEFSVHDSRVGYILCSVIYYIIAVCFTALAHPTSTGHPVDHHLRNAREQYPTIESYTLNIIL